MKRLVLFLITSVPVALAGSAREHWVSLDFYNSSGSRIGGGAFITDGSSGSWTEGTRNAYPELLCAQRNGTSRTLKSVTLFDGISVRNRVVNGNLLLIIRLAKVNSVSAEIAAVSAGQCLTIRPTQSIFKQRIIVPLTKKATGLRLSNGDYLKYVFKPL